MTMHNKTSYATDQSVWHQSIDASLVCQICPGRYKACKGGCLMQCFNWAVDVQLAADSLCGIAVPYWQEFLADNFPLQMTIPHPGNQHVAIPRAGYIRNSISLMEPVFHNLQNGDRTGPGTVGIKPFTYETACAASYGSHVVTALQASKLSHISVWSYSQSEEEQP